MATLGNIDPVRIDNALFDSARIDHAAQGYQRNALALEGEQQQMADTRAFRALGPDIAAGDQGALRQAMVLNPAGGYQIAHGLAQLGRPDAEAAKAAAAERHASIETMQGMAGVLSTLPEDQQESAYNKMRDIYGAQGVKLPPVYPGAAAARIMADLSLTPAQREERLKNTYSAAGNNAPGVGPSPDFATRMIGVESGGDPNARNPRSSATGAGQFIRETWLDLLPKAKPDLAAGKSPAELLAMRNDPALAKEMVNAYARQNGQTLANAGLPVNDATLALAHRFGPDGAMKVLRASPQMPLATLMGADVMGANPDLAGKSAADILGMYQRRVGGQGVQLASRTGPGATMTDASGSAAPAPTMQSPAALPDRNRLGEYDTRGAPHGMAFATIGGVRTAVPLPGASDPDIQTHINPKDGSVIRFNKRTGQVERLGVEGAEGGAAPMPYSGNAMEAQTENKLLTGDPSTREYAAAYARHAAEKVLPDGTRIQPDMRPYQVPTFGGGQAAAGVATAPQAPMVPNPLAPDAPAAPVDAAPPPGVPGRATVTPGEGKFNEGQANAAGFADRMIASEGVILQPGPSEAVASRRQKALANAPLIGNNLVSSDYQQGDQAQRNFINAQLRRESGAAISPGEFENARQQYFPQPGDGAAVLKQKAENRATAIEAMKRSAGPAYKQPGGGATTAAKSSETPAPPPGFRLIGP